MATDRKRCAATRKDGSPCQADALSDSMYCWAHCPERKAQRDEARRRGGRNSAKIVRLKALIPQRLAPTYDILESTLAGVLVGKISPQQGQAAASIARAMCSVLSSGELEQRLRDLERNIQGGADRWEA